MAEFFNIAAVCKVPGSPLGSADAVIDMAVDADANEMVLGFAGHNGSSFEHIDSNYADPKAMTWDTDKGFITTTSPYNAKSLRAFSIELAACASNVLDPGTKNDLRILSARLGEAAKKAKETR